MTNDELARLYLDSANTALIEGDPTAALTHLQQAVKLNPKMHEIHYLYSLSYYRKGELDRAIQSAKKTIELAPDFTPVKNTLGRLYLEKGNLELAEKPLLEAAADLTNREAYLAKTNLGLLHSKKKNSHESERWYSKAILDGGNAACMASYYRGEIHLSRNDLEKAHDDFKRASKYNCSGFTDAHLAVGKTLMMMKKNQQARAKFIEVQQLFPSTNAAEKANQYLKEIQ